MTEKIINRNFLGSVHSEGIPRKPKTCHMQSTWENLFHGIHARQVANSWRNLKHLTIKRGRRRKVTTVSFWPRKKLVMITLDLVKLGRF